MFGAIPRRMMWMTASSCGGGAERIVVRSAPWRHRTGQLAMLAAATAVGGGLVWLLDTAPYPYAQRWLLDIPLPWLTPRRLAAALDAQPGDRVLEIGPGTGLQALHIAPQLEDGRLDIVDIQQPMLDHVMQRAEEQGVTNITPRQAEAGELPFPDGTYDAAYLVTVLGEIPDQTAALGELARVLRPGGRLVVGEFVDRHFVQPGKLAEEAARHGLDLVDRAGPPFAYYATFRRAAPAARPVVVAS